MSGHGKIVHCTAHNCSFAFVAYSHYDATDVYSTTKMMCSERKWAYWSAGSGWSESQKIRDGTRLGDGMQGYWKRSMGLRP